MNFLSQIWWTAKAVGWDNLPRRLLQAWRVRGGYLQRKLAPQEFSDDAFAAAGGGQEANQVRLWAQRMGRFFPSPSPVSLRAIVDDRTWAGCVTGPCQRALEGSYPFFGRWSGQLDWPPRFNHDVVDGFDWPVGMHWLRSAFPADPPGDIKVAWEPSRLQLAFLLARSVARDGDALWAQAFWRLFDAWVQQNPPQRSIAWACGQEIAFRLMALLVGAATTLETPFATPARLHALTKLVWQSGRHIHVNINQARMQGNNHALSEAAALWTIGLLFGELREAPAWRDQARAVLACEAQRQVYADGSYVQHSLNYHRVMIDDLLWVCRLGELGHDPVPEPVTAALRRGAAWLLEMVDPVSGRVPNYGANDGANVLPLACADYDDYRPVAQAAGYFLHHKRLLPPGPWDEKLLWLWGPAALEAAPVRPARARAFSARGGGYYVLRGEQSWAMTRCHSYRDRPGQADMLHLDLFYRGLNVLHDAGSYRYRCGGAWQHYFPSTAAHNTIQIDGQDQLVKGPRFLWFEWTRAELIQFGLSPGGRCGCFEGEHFGYRRLGGRIIHRRLICRIDDAYVIVDTVLGDGRHDLALRWHLIDAQGSCDGQGPAVGLPLRTTVPAPHGAEKRASASRRQGVMHEASSSSSVGDPHVQACLSPSCRWVAALPGLADQPGDGGTATPQALAVSIYAGQPFATRLLRGQEEPAIEGWQSRYYGLKEPSPVLVTRGVCDLPVRLVTVIALADSPLAVEAGSLSNLAAAIRLTGVDEAGLAGEIEQTCGGRIKVGGAE